MSSRHRRTFYSRRNQSKYSRNAMSNQDKKTAFHSTYRRHQPWSLPDSIMHYISKNPSTSKCYGKMVQSCKYFFIQNPILISQDLHLNYEENGWYDAPYYENKEIDFKQASSKIWVIESMDNSTSDPSTSSIPLSPLISKIFRSDIKLLMLYHKFISYKDLKFLGSKCDRVALNQVIVKDENGSNVALKEIFEVFPKVEHFLYYFGNSASRNIHELIKCPNFLDITGFNLHAIPENFDIQGFYDLAKKNEKIEIWLSFSPQISNAYRNRLQKIVDEIIADKNRVYKPPLIEFPGIILSSYGTLRKISGHRN